MASTRSRSKGILLDTNALVWWFDDDRKLGIIARSAMTSGVPVYVSAASPWELQIKRNKRHAPLLDTHVLNEIERSGFHLLPITAEDGITAGGLPRHHEDPFDRMLVAQCMRHGLAMVSSDAQMRRYEIPVLPATA